MASVQSVSSSTRTGSQASLPPTLREGARGAAAAKLQRLLVSHGFNPHGVDAWFGPMTRAAVLAFQRSRGLKQDGVVGPVTWAALLRTSSSSPGTTHGTTHGASVNQAGWNNVSSFQQDYQDTGYTCGPSSLQMLFSELAGGKVKIREGTLASIAGTGHNGTGPDEMVSAARAAGNRIGIPVSAHKSSFGSVGWAKLAELVKDPSKGVIMHIMTGGLPGWQGDYGHYVYPIGVNLKARTVRIADPTKGVREYTFAQYERAMGRISSANQLIVVGKR
jgi:peptidoglycan hydrolase-like protein with peptidoglycan-binding domain